MRLYKGLSLLLVIPLSVLLGGAPVAAAQPVQLAFEPLSLPGGAVADDHVQQAAERLSSLVDRLPEQFTGVRITGVRSLLLALPQGQHVGARESVARQELGSDAELGITLTFAHVKHSRASLNAVKAELVELLRARRYGGQVTGVGEDPSRGVAVVYATSSSEVAQSELRSRYGDAVIFRHLDEVKAYEADRDRDTAAHYAGAGYLQWNAAHTAFFDIPGTDRDWCSTSFPVERSGVRYMLTAGHCMPGGGTFRNLWASAFRGTSIPSNPSYYFGGLYTTTVAGTEANPTDGTQDAFGDWALIQSSTYYPRVYNCFNVTGTCSSLPVGAASWTSPVMGAGACTSGRTTAQICRQEVVDPDLTISVGGLLTAHLAMIRSDQNLDGVFDCTGPRSGDSGGAVYQAISNRPGYVRAMGTITGGDDNPTGGCSSVYTKLSGLRAWGSTFTMPTL